MKEQFIKPQAQIFLFKPYDVITSSAIIPPYENDNEGEWEDVE